MTPKTLFNVADGPSCCMFVPPESCCFGACSPSLNFNTCKALFFVFAGGGTKGIKSGIQKQGSCQKENPESIFFFLFSLFLCHPVCSNISSWRMKGDNSFLGVTPADKRVTSLPSLLKKDGLLPSPFLLLLLKGLLIRTRIIIGIRLFSPAGNLQRRTAYTSRPSS